MGVPLGCPYGRCCYFRIRRADWSNFVPVPGRHQR